MEYRMSKLELYKREDGHIDFQEANVSFTPNIRQLLWLKLYFLTMLHNKKAPLSDKFSSAC